MKLFRIRHKGELRYGVLEENELLLLSGEPFEKWSTTGERVKFSETELLPPVHPSKVVALGLNYRDHAREMKLSLPSDPILFLKPSSSVIGPGVPIVYPGGGITGRVDYEAELAVVIGKRCRQVRAEAAAEYILGYTCLNDVTARDLQAKDGQWTRAKSFDTFCPLGPCIETELDPSNLQVQAVLNGRTVQDGNTRELVFSVPEILYHVSRVMTLFPGDVIATGTPAGIGPLKPGDTVTIHVQGIGRLTNPVQQEPNEE